MFFFSPCQCCSWKLFMTDQYRVIWSEITCEYFMYFLREWFFLSCILSFLFQVISVEECSCQMTATKIEIRMRKAEAGSWAKLEVPRMTVRFWPCTTPRQIKMGQTHRTILYRTGTRFNGKRARELCFDFNLRRRGCVILRPKYRVV